MSPVVDLRGLLANFNGRPGASDAVIAETEKQLGLSLPKEYVAFTKLMNGGEGFIGRGYAILWGLEDLAAVNQEYEFAKHVPRFLGFGSNGGGEAFGFDTRLQRWAVVQVPFVGLNWNDARPMGESFNEFLAHLNEIP